MTTCLPSLKLRPWVALDCLCGVAGVEVHPTKWAKYRFSYSCDVSMLLISKQSKCYTDRTWWHSPWSLHWFVISRHWLSWIVVRRLGPEDIVFSCMLHCKASQFGDDYHASLAVCVPGGCYLVPWEASQYSVCIVMNPTKTLGVVVCSWEVWIMSASVWKFPFKYSRSHLQPDN